MTESYRKLTPDQIESLAATIKPGTIIQIPGGTYRKADGWDWPLSGTYEQRVIVEPLPNESVTLEGYADVGGGDVGVVRIHNVGNLTLRRGRGRMFRITDQHPNRVLSGAANNRPPCVDLRSAPYITFEQLIMDDAGFGILVNKQSTDCTVRDCVITKTGWDDPYVVERGRGHGVYAQGDRFHAVGSVFTLGFSRAIQSFATTVSIIDHTIEDCVMNGAGHPSAIVVNKAPYTFLSDQNEMDGLIMRRCVLRSELDDGTKSSIQLGENGDVSRHGSIDVSDSSFYGTVAIQGKFTSIKWDSNYTIGRITGGGGHTPVNWGSWRDDWADELEAYGDEFITGSATRSTFIYGHPREEITANRRHEYWTNKFGHVTLYNVASASNITINPSASFIPGDWIEVTTLTNTTNPVSVFQYNGKSKTFPITGIIDDPVGITLSASRREEVVRMQTFILRKLYDYEKPLKPQPSPVIKNVGYGPTGLTLRTVGDTPSRTATKGVMPGELAIKTHTGQSVTSGEFEHLINVMNSPGPVTASIPSSSDSRSGALYIVRNGNSFGTRITSSVTPISDGTSLGYALSFEGEGSSVVLQSSVDSWLVLASSGSYVIS